MANNRLYLYDPEDQSAILLAKGWGSGWQAWYPLQLDPWLEGRDILSACSSANKTKLELRTERDLPEGTDIYPSADRSRKGDK